MQMHGSLIMLAVLVAGWFVNYASSTIQTAREH